MKLLIDGYDKQTRTIANNIRFCRDLQVLVYDPEYFTVDKLDLNLMQNLVKRDNKSEALPPFNYEDDFGVVDNKITFLNEPTTVHNSWIMTTTDIDSALEWCDCYACFNSIEWDLITASDYEGKCKDWQVKLDRIHWIKEHHKKLYLSHRLDDIFKKESEYDNMFNTVIDKNRLEHMRQLSNNVLNAQSKETDIKLVVGTYSACGKFSLALKCKEWYDTHNERTGIIFTEDTADLINSWYIENNKLDDSLIINAAREWNDLTLDEYIEYVLHCVAYLEQRGCKHILLQGQGSYGLHEMNKFYINKNSNAMAINNVIMEYAVGARTVAIAACVDMQQLFWETYDHFDRLGIEVTDVYFNTFNHREAWKTNKHEFDIDGIKGYISLYDVHNNNAFLECFNELYSVNNKANIYSGDFLSYLLHDHIKSDTVEYNKYIANVTLMRITTALNNIANNFAKIGHYEIFKNEFATYFRDIINGYLNINDDAVGIILDGNMHPLENVELKMNSETDNKIKIKLESN